MDVRVQIRWNVKLRFVAICEKEGGVARHGMLARIESVVCNWQPLDPVVPPLRAESMKIHLNLLVKALSLTICLWMIHLQERTSKAESLKDSLE